MTLYAGEIVLIAHKVKIDNKHENPDSMKISILKDSRDGTEVLAPVDMTNTGTGLYEYGWDSTGQTAGVYYAKLHATKTAPGNWEFVKIELY